MNTLQNTVELFTFNMIKKKLNKYKVPTKISEKKSRKKKQKSRDKLSKIFVKNKRNM